MRKTIATLAVLLALATPARAADDAIAAPTLRASISVTADVVRVGDLVDNAGSSALIPVYRSPDLGTTGALPVAQVLSVLRAKQVIGVMTGDIREVTVTRLARSIANKDLELAVATALERRFGLGEAANIAVTFDRGVSDMRLDASNTGALQASGIRYDQRTGRFDITFEIANDATAAPTRLRFTGNAIETVEVGVLTRDVDRTEMLKSSDIVPERRPKAEVAGEAAARDRAVGMQLRRPMRAGTPLRMADLAKPDLVQRDQNVTIIYQVPGLYLTTRGKAVESGAEGDTVSVLNIQSKRTLFGTVTGRGQVTVQGASQSAPLPPADQTSSLQRDPSPLQRDTSSLQRDTSSLQRDTSSLQRDTSSLRRDTSSLQRNETPAAVALASSLVPASPAKSE